MCQPTYPHSVSGSIVQSFIARRNVSSHLVYVITGFFQTVQMSSLSAWKYYSFNRTSFSEEGLQNIYCVSSGIRYLQFPLFEANTLHWQPTGDAGGLEAEDKDKYTQPTECRETTLGGT
jgi:hypothetical protein